MEYVFQEKIYKFGYVHITERHLFSLCVYICFWMRSLAACWMYRAELPSAAAAPWSWQELS